MQWLRVLGAAFSHQIGRLKGGSNVSGRTSSADKKSKRTLGRQTQRGRGRPGMPAKPLWEWNSSQVEAAEMRWWSDHPLWCFGESPGSFICPDDGRMLTSPSGLLKVWGGGCQVYSHGSPASVPPLANRPHQRHLGDDTAHQRAPGDGAGLGNDHCEHRHQLQG